MLPGACTVTSPRVSQNSSPPLSSVCLSLSMPTLLLSSARPRDSCPVSHLEAAPTQASLTLLLPDEIDSTLRFLLLLGLILTV